MPKTREIPVRLDKKGCARVEGEDPGFADAPYCVLLGLRVRKRGATCYGTLNLPGAGDYCYAEVKDSGSYDVHVRLRALKNKNVTIICWAIPESWTHVVAIGPSTLGPTPIPTKPPGFPFGTPLFDPQDYPGRYVGEVPGIGPESVRRLTKKGMKSLAALASADFEPVAKILSTSEVRAMNFIYRARALLRQQAKK